MPMENGCLDTKLGVSDKVSKCATCHRKLADCAGHFGHVKLELPVFHIGFFKAIVTILQNICKSCSSVLVNDAVKQKILKKLKNPALESPQRLLILKHLNAECRKVIRCPKCNELNGQVKKIGALKIIHEKYKHKQAAEESTKFKSHFKRAIEENNELQSLLGRVKDDLHPLRCYSLFEKITKEVIVIYI